MRIFSTGPLPEPVTGSGAYGNTAKLRRHSLHRTAKDRTVRRRENRGHSRYPARAAILATVFAVGMTACSTFPVGFDDKNATEARALIRGPVPLYPETSFMVFSDPHVFDAEALGGSGPEFQAYLDQDRKLLVESIETLGVMIERILDRKPAFVLVSGDLTKDGERHNHEIFARSLRLIEEAGIEVFVVPGNHDINNPDSLRFGPRGPEPVPTVDPAAFAKIYRDFGYGQAIARDPASLSYVAEPVPGLRMLAIDSNDYDDNVSLGRPVTAGRLKPETVMWIEKQLKQAAAAGIPVIAQQHHGVVEHYLGQSLDFWEYLVRDRWNLARLFAVYNVRMVFTGHYHSTDIAGVWWKDDNHPLGELIEGKYLFDIETGSLVTWPCSYRTVDINSEGIIRVSTGDIPQIPSFAAAGKDFAAKGRAFILEAIAAIAERTLVKYGSPLDEAERFSAAIGAGALAHYRGDEVFVPNDPILGTGTAPIPEGNLSLVGAILVKLRRHVLEGFWDDPAPADREISIYPDGSWKDER